MTDFDSMTRKFLMGEAIEKPGMISHLQALEQTLGMLQPRSKTDTRRVEVARSHLYEMKRHYKRIEQENKRLQEQLSLLEEEKNNARIEEDYS